MRPPDGASVLAALAGALALAGAIALVGPLSEPLAAGSSAPPGPSGRTQTRTARHAAAPTPTHRPAPAAEPPGTPPALLPDLLPLARGMTSLQVSSERFSMKTFLSVSGANLPPGAGALFSLFDVSISGEAELSPPAGSFKLTLFGSTVNMRVAGGSVYLYEPDLARRDGGRPWIDFGPSGSAGLLGGPESPNPGSLPAAVGGTSFGTLAKALLGAPTVLELGGGTIDGLAIAGFRTTVARSTLEEPSTSPPRPNRSGPLGPLGPFALIAAAGRTGLPAVSKPVDLLARAARNHWSTVAAATRRPRRPSPPRARLEMFIAPTGLPVRTRIESRSEGLTVATILDIPAINFPLTIAAPPPRQTIGLAALERLVRKHAKRRAPRGENERN